MPEPLQQPYQAQNPPNVRKDLGFWPGRRLRRPFGCERQLAARVCRSGAREPVRVSESVETDAASVALGTLEIVLLAVEVAEQ